MTSDERAPAIETDQQQETTGEKWLRVLGLSALGGYRVMHRGEELTMSRFDEICGDHIKDEMTFLEKGSPEHPSYEPVHDFMRRSALHYAGVTPEEYVELERTHQSEDQTSAEGSV